jgi:excisionase family DNA binding protein
MNEAEYMTAGEARLYLGITKTKLAKMIADGDLPAIINPLNKRVKLVRRADVDRLASLPRPKRVPVAA